jgi:WD40 repeat protein
MSKVPAQIMNDAKDSVTRVVFREDSTVFASSLDGCIRRYDGRRERMTDDLFDRPISAFDVSKDASLGVACFKSRGIALIDLEAGEELRMMHASDKDVLPVCWCGLTEEYIAVADEKLYIYDVLSSAKPLRIIEDISYASNIAYSHGILICPLLTGKVSLSPLWRE